MRSDGHHLWFVLCLAVGLASTGLGRSVTGQDTNQQAVTDQSLRRLDKLPMRKPTESIKIPDAWDIEFDDSSKSPRTRPYISPDGKRVFLTEAYESVRLWTALVAHWPYSLILPSLIVLLFGFRSLRRQWGRVQVPGESYCGNCNYHLAGSESEKCPECGANVTGKLRAEGRSRKRRIMPSCIVLICIPMVYGALFLVNPYQRGVGDWFQWRSEAAFTWASENSLEFITQHSIGAYRVKEFDLKTQQGGEPIYDRHDAAPALAFSDDSRSLFVVDGLRLMQKNIKRDEEVFSLTAYKFDELIPTSTPRVIVSNDQRSLYSFNVFLPPLEWNLVEHSVRELPWDDVPVGILGKPSRKPEPIIRPKAVDLKPWPYYNMIAAGLLDADTPGQFNNAPHIWMKMTDNEKLFYANDRPGIAEIQMWDIRQRKLLQRVKVPSLTKPFYFAPSDDGKRLFVATIDTQSKQKGINQWSIRVWDTTEKKWIGGFRLPRTFVVGSWFLVARGRPLLIMTGRDRIHASWPAFIWHYDISEFLPKKEPDSDQVPAKAPDSSNAGNQDK